MKEKGYGPVLLMKKKRIWTPLQNEQGCLFDFLEVKKRFVYLRVLTVWYLLEH